jgi:hypothetical protein
MNMICRPDSAYPENLSRIILTLTVSPSWNQTLRTKFSSIQGSSSPILRNSVNTRTSEATVVRSVGEDAPQGSLATVTSAAISGRRSATIVVGCGGGAGLSRLRNNLASRRIAAGRGSRSSLLLGEVVVLLERHDFNFW